MFLNKTHGLRHATRGARAFQYDVAGQKRGVVAQALAHALSKKHQSLLMAEIHRRDRQEAIDARLTGREIRDQMRADEMRMRNAGMGELSSLNEAADYYYTSDPSGRCADGYSYGGSTPSNDAGGNPVIRCNKTGSSYTPPPRPAPAPAPPIQNNPVFTVSPVIQTTVSPQISPIFQQAFQPSGSPMSAGTTQTSPTSNQAATAGAQPSGDTAFYKDLIKTLLSSQATAPVQSTVPLISSSAYAPVPLSPVPSAPVYSPPASVYSPVPSMPSSAETVKAVQPVLSNKNISLVKSPIMWIIIGGAVLGGLLIISKRGNK